MEELIGRLHNIAYAIGCEATKYDLVFIEEVMKTISNTIAALKEK